MKTELPVFAGKLRRGDRSAVGGGVKETISARVKLLDAGLFAPPLDGSPIVAVGRVIWEDDFSTAMDPFKEKIYWAKTDSGFEGWLHYPSGLAVARSLSDEVIVDSWVPYPGSNRARRDLAEVEARLSADSRYERTAA